MVAYGMWHQCDAIWCDRSKMSMAPAAAAAPAKPATKKRAAGAGKAKKPADHPKYSDMIKAALTALKVKTHLVWPHQPENPPGSGEA